MKKGIIIIGLLISVQYLVAQRLPNIQTVMATDSIDYTIKGKQLIIQWTNTDRLIDYWEILGSVNDRTYTVIGVMLGEDPNKSGTYTFKQDMRKLRRGLKYFKVIQVKESVATAQIN